MAAINTMMIKTEKSVPIECPLTLAKIEVAKIDREFASGPVRDIMCWQALNITESVLEGLFEEKSGCKDRTFPMRLAGVEKDYHYSVAELVRKRISLVFLAPSDFEVTTVDDRDNSGVYAIRVRVIGHLPDNLKCVKGL